MIHEHEMQPRTSRLAVISLITGIASLVAPLCACPLLIFGLARTRTVSTMPAPVAVTFTPAVPMQEGAPPTDQRPTDPHGDDEADGESDDTSPDGDRR